MLVATKTYDREQNGKKNREKLRMKAEEGAHRVKFYAVRQGRKREIRASKDDGDGPGEWLQTNVSFDSARDGDL